VATDFIRLGTIRKGWRLLGMKAVIPVNWLAATATIDIGINGGDVDEYLDAGVVGAAAVQLDAGHTTALGFGEVVAADFELFVTVNTAGAGSAPTSVAYFIVYYARD
jgi:hypothetical protein